MNELDKEWRRKFWNLRKAARQKGVACHLTLDQYINLAKEAGIESPNQIGQKIDSFQMGRLGDVGDYELGNCRFITFKQNLDEMTSNGGRSNAINKMIGRTKDNNQSIASQSDKISKWYRMVSPTGEVFEGKNLKEFCKERGLTVSLVYLVFGGKAKHHKGWTGEYIDELVD